jgi:integrase/recombinase XerD
MLDHFLAAKAAAGLSPRTITTYRLHVGHFVAWLDGRALTRPVLRAYLEYLSADKRPVTVANYIRDVSVYCAWLVAEGDLDLNPTIGLKPKLPKRRPPSYTKRQINALLDGADPRDRALIIVLLDTGLRAGELVSMTQDSVDTLTGHFAVIGKGDKERSGWLSSYALKAVRTYLSWRVDDHPALWYGAGGPLTVSGVYQVIRRRARAAGIAGEVRRLLHSFRATFAKTYLKRGGDLESLRRLLGHESIAMSAHYAQLADDELGERKAEVNPLAGMVDDAA